MTSLNVVATRPVYLTREGSVFRLAFDYSEALVNRARTLPYASFDGETKSWSALVCTQSVDLLREWFYDGLTDVAVDALLEPGEQLSPCKEATLRSGSLKRPFLVHTAFRDDRLYSRLKSIPGAQWERNAGGLSYGPLCGAALAELVARGVIDDPERLLNPAGVVVAFDGRTGTFAVRGDDRAAASFTQNFPAHDVMAVWRDKGLDVAFADEMTEEIYRGERARVGPGLQPEGLVIPLFEYQMTDVAMAAERTGLAVLHSPGLGKCLHGDVPVVVNGTLRPIGELWDTYAGPTTPSEDGIGEWAVPSVPLAVHATTAGGRAVLAPASRLYRQHVTETLRKVRLADGSEVTVTAQHQLLSEAKGWTTDIAVGDRLAIPRRLEWTGSPVDPDLVHIMAWQISEGNESPRVVRITQNDTAVLETLREAFARYGSRNGIELNSMRITTPANRAAYLAVNSLAWQKHLEDLGYEWGHVSAGKTIPDCIMEGDSAASAQFLREYFAAEGSVVHGMRSIEIASASPVLMAQLSTLLRRHGIWMRTEVKMKHATNGTRIDRPYSIGLISGEALRAYANRIGFSDPVKTAKLERIVAERCNTNLETVATQALLTEAVAVSRVPRMVLRADGGQHNEFMGRGRALGIVEALDDVLSGQALIDYQERCTRSQRGMNRWAQRTMAALQSVNAAELRPIRDAIEARATEEIQYVKITSIVDVEHDGYVYDLEVPGHHNFVAGGMVCHNTASAIGAAHEVMTNRGLVPRTVCVVPGAVRSQWKREIIRFTGCDPDDVVVIDGSKKKREEGYEAAQTAKWLVVHYDILNRDYKMVAPLVAGSYLIADEAHRLKNPTAKRTKAMRQLANRAARRLALTGTPVENAPGEWFSVLSGFAVPGCFGSAQDFLTRYCYEGRFGGYEGARRIPELRDRSRVYYVRRTKAEVATHLPPLRVQHMPLDPDPTYAAALKRAHREARNEIADAARARVTKTSGGVLDGQLLEDAEQGAEMTAVGMLRLMCSSPRLVAESDSEAAQAMRDAGIVPDVDGPKIDELRTIGAEMQAAGERVVIFTFSKRMANLIAQRFTEDGVRHVMFTGDTSSKDRDRAVEAFTSPGTETDPGPTAFIATDAAAEGLNLAQQCSTLVNCDIPWVASRLEQRSNRIHRVDGTSPSYLVINLTTRGTIEDGILRMVEQKADLQDALFGEGGGRKRTTGRAGRSIFEQAMDDWTANN